ncbi:MAG TPA: PrsW family glutamic-type intramembrane protease [Myxococcales bacterium]|nr:PrsW family glutamic-type intramembrane protease [Myxococcales bacterium]
MASLEESVAMAVAALSAIGWLLYFRWKDRARPEPPWIMAAAAGGGMAAVLLAFLGYRLGGAAGADTSWEQLQDAPALPAIAAALRVGGVEEVCKLVVVLPIALWASHFDEVLDGIVYAACSAAGFATAETAWLFTHGEWAFGDALGRGVVAPITHALLAAPWGLGLSLALLRRRRWALPLGLLLSITAHAAYDLLLARPGVPPALSAVVMLALWLWFLRAAPRLAREAPVVRAPP